MPYGGIPFVSFMHAPNNTWDAKDVYGDPTYKLFSIITGCVALTFVFILASVACYLSERKHIAQLVGQWCARLRGWVARCVEKLDTGRRGHARLRGGDIECNNEVDVVVQVWHNLGESIPEQMGADTRASNYPTHATTGCVVDVNLAFHAASSTPVQENRNGFIEGVGMEEIANTKSEEENENKLAMEEMLAQRANAAVETHEPRSLELVLNA